MLFNVAQEVVDDTLPEATWDRTLAATGLEGAYTSLGDYPDADLTAIVGEISASTGLSPEDVLRHVGQHGYTHLTSRHADLVAGIGDLGSLLHHLEDVIHPEVRKLQPDASPPSFRVTDLGPASWQVEYRSQRHLCALAEGLIQGAAQGFGSSCAVERTRCVADGDDHCRLIVTVPA